MRISYSAVTLTLFASLALAQTKPEPRPAVPSDPPEHQRHEDDDDPPPASAAAVLPDSPVITIKGICDHASGIDSSSGDSKGSATVSSQKESGSDSAPSAISPCQTVLTKAQFENLVQALNPQMPVPAQRQLAESYPRYLVFASKARELGLDQDPHFAESLRFAAMQLLTQRLNRYFSQQASIISDQDVEKYYKGSAVKFERAELLRIFIPRQTRQAQNTASGAHPSTTIDSPMMTVAEKIRTRAAAGEDVQLLQKEAFEAAGIASESPHVSTGKIAADGLPLTHQKVFDLEPGQVSEVFADPSGYCIYKVVSKEMVPLAKVSNEIRKSIASDRVHEATAALANSIQPELDPKYFGASAVSSRHPGPTASKPGDRPAPK